METILRQLERRTDQLIEKYSSASTRVTELEGRVQELEEQVSADSQAQERIRSLEQQRDELGERLRKVLDLIDGVLDSGDDDSGDDSSGDADIQ